MLARVKENRARIYGDVMLGVLFSSVGKSMPKRIQSSPNDFTSDPTHEVATVDE
jgi:hypothetical protein